MQTYYITKNIAVDLAFAVTLQENANVVLAAPGIGGYTENMIVYGIKKECPVLIAIIDYNNFPKLAEAIEKDDGVTCAEDFFPELKADAGDSFLDGIEARILELWMAI